MILEKDIFGLIEYTKNGILSKELFKDKKFDSTLFCMTAKTKISKHTATRRGLVYIVEGHGVFNLEGKDIKMKKGVMIFMKENSVHSLVVEDNTSFVLVLFD